MNKIPGNNYFKKPLIWLGQLLAMLGVFLLASAYQERDLLDESGEQQAPNFVLPLLHPTVDSDTHSLQQLKGKTSIIYFFAPWCNVCRFSMPNLETIYQKGQINAVAVALDYQSKQQVEAFADKLGLTLPIVLGNQQMALDYKIKGYPTYYVLDSELKITERSVGYSSQLGLQYRLNNP